jgi:hypothetical protein
MGNHLNKTLDLFPIGNCAVSALIDTAGRFVWACAPRVDSDPVFSALLDDADPDGPDAKGLSAQHPDPADRDRRRGRRADRDPRLRPALPAVRPHLSPDGLHPPDPPAGRRR